MLVPKPRPIRARRKPSPPPLAIYAGLVVAAGALLTIGGTRAVPGEAPAVAAAAPAAVHEGVVTRVVDGDTFYMTGVERRIRVWGLDAPEKSDAGGPAATEALARIASGKRLSCEQMDVDRYQRIVGRCTLPNGDDIAALMIESGAAREYLRYSGGYYGGRP